MGNAVDAVTRNRPVWSEHRALTTVTGVEFGLEVVPLPIWPPPDGLIEVVWLEPKV